MAMAEIGDGIGWKMRAKASISVIVPTLNGLRLLREHIPALIEEMEGYGGEYEILIADDNSDDGTVEYVAGLGRQFRLCCNPGKRGFSVNVNQAAKQARHELIFLLNNDVLLTEGVTASLGRCFDDPLVFGASPDCIVRRNGKEFNEMPTRWCWRMGMVQMGGTPGPSAGPGANREIDHISGGVALVRREMFAALGGFDEIFNPFYWEDTDLSMRARRRGWRLIHDGSSRVYHRHQSTIGSVFSERRVAEVFWRNAFLFSWIHLPEEMLRRGHLARIHDLLLSSLGQSGPSLDALLDALEKLPDVMQRRLRLRATDAVQVEDLIPLEEK